MADDLFTFSVKIPGMDAYILGIQRFADLIGDWTPFWNDYFRDAWYRSIDTHYVTQGGSTGATWPQLSERYGLWKQKHWPGLPIGVLSGATRESMTFKDDPNAVWVASSTGLSVGTNVPYAWWLQVGTRKMPARPPMRVTPDFVTQTGKLMHEFAVKSLHDAVASAARA